MPKHSTQRNVVVIVAYGTAGNLIERIELPYESYYDESTPIIDESAYRANRQIRYLVGEVYDSDAQLQQRFETFYDDRGSYVRSRVVHQNGTVIED